MQINSRSRRRTFIHLHRSGNILGEPVPRHYGRSERHAYDVGSTEVDQCPLVYSVKNANFFSLEAPTIKPSSVRKFNGPALGGTTW